MTEAGLRLEATAIPALRRRRLAAALGSLAILEVGAILALGAVGEDRVVLSLDIVTIGFLSAVVTFSVVGALVAQQRPMARVPWLLLAIGVGIGTAIVTFTYGEIGVGPQFQWPFAVWAIVASPLFFFPTISMVATLLLLVFPDDRLIGPRWRAVPVVALGGVLAFVVGTIFSPGAFDLSSPPPVANPLGAPVALAGLLDAAIVLGNALALIGMFLAAISLVIRYRRADAMQAAQIRWLVVAAGLAPVALGFGALQTGPISDVSFGLGILALAAMPVAIGIAITRYRLYEIDRLINRALVYGSLTAILAGVFTAAVGLAQRLFIALTGDTSDAAIVATTLIVATLYAPLRKRLEGVVDRRFKYDEARFGAYRQELTSYLSLADPQRAAERLAREALVELRATGTAVLDDEGKVTAAAGSWPATPALRIPIPGGGRRLASIVAGPRLDNRPHEVARLAALEDLAELVGLATRTNSQADQQPGGPTARRTRVPGGRTTSR